MALSLDTWRLGGRAAARQLTTLVEHDGHTDHGPRVLPLLMYVVGDESKTAQLVGMNNVQGAVATIIAEESPDRHALAVDASVGEGSAKVDALVVMLEEGEAKAVVAVPYRVPFRMGEPLGLPEDIASLEAFRQGLQAGGDWERLQRRIGPLLGEPPDPAPTPTPVVRRRARRAELGELRLQGGMLQRLRGSGEVRAEFPADEIRVAAVRRRELLGTAVALGIAATIAGGAVLCGGGWGLAIAALPALALVGVAGWFAIERRSLEIRHDEGLERWPIDPDVTQAQLDDFVAAVEDRPRPSTVHPGELVAHLYFTEDPPSDIPDTFIGYARHELIDDVEDHLLAPQGLIYAVAKRYGMSPRLQGLLQHLMRTRWHVEIRVPEGAIGMITEWARGTTFIAMLPDGTVTDNRLRSLLTLTGETAHPTAALPFPADALDRRKRTMAGLAALGVHKVRVPPVVGELEVVLRSPPQVARRALALAVVVAPLAASVRSGGTVPERQELAGRWGELMHALTREERAFLDSADPAVAARLAWRMEAAATLYWALGWLDAPLSMDQPIGAEPMLDARQRLGEPVSKAVDEATLRPTTEVLDLLDQVYCRRWAAVDAGARDRSLPGVLHARVLLERHYALNWLTSFGNERSVDWDDVETPT